MKKIKSLHDLYSRCEAGDEAAQRLAIGTLQQFGCEHLADSFRGPKSDPKWRRYFRGIHRYFDSLCGEYGIPEGKAEREIVAEINNVRDCCDDVPLTD